MDNRTGIWSWLSNPEHQKTLAFIGGGIVAVAAAGWQIYLHFADTRAPVQPASTIATPAGVTPGGVTVGGNVSGSPIIAGGNVTIGTTPVDPAEAKKLMESQAKAVDSITSRMNDISRAIETGDTSKLTSTQPPDAKEQPAPVAKK